jgi:uncharacterized protein
VAELFAGLDRASFAASLSARLRGAGVPVRLDATQRLLAGMRLRRPTTRADLYWLARVTLVTRVDDLAAFDRVFAALFGDVLPAVSTSTLGATTNARADAPMPAGRLEPSGVAHRAGVPWRTRAIAATEPDGEATTPWPLRLPSDLVGLAEEPFEALDDRQLAALGAWLESTARSWPRRRSRRLATGQPGSRIDLRASLARARRTGWEPAQLVSAGPRRRMRRVVMLCDVSQSMRAQAVAYLHLMRALVRAYDGEVFAFSTTLTRLTATLRTMTAPLAMAAASEQVADRLGGTRIASNLSAVLASRHRETLRGAVVVIASDGWDSDRPDALAAAMIRVRRRAFRVVWINPRAGAVDFEPRVGGLAAALPYCDALLPAATFADLRQVLVQLPR